VREGALGRVLWARQCEKHAGPYSPWFFTREEAGGGALLDMGCHSLELLRWLFDKPRIVRVEAELATVCTASARGSTTTRASRSRSRTARAAPVGELLGGAQRHAEHARDPRHEGSLWLDLVGETGLRVWRKDGGHTPVSIDPLLENGYVGELEHFVSCALSGDALEESAEDGRAVLELLLAAYASAGEGRAIELPFRPRGVERPIDLWRR
jgi:predicted dehydrogenase